MIIRANMNCICCKRFPWHLFSVAREGFVHHCHYAGEPHAGGCGRVWRWMSITSAELVDGTSTRERTP